MLLADMDTTVPSPTYPPEVQKWLDHFYAQFGSTKPEEKLALLNRLYGPSNFSHDLAPSQMVAAIEYELLSNEGLIELQLV
jgi:hypothetical protein